MRLSRQCSKILIEVDRNNLAVTESRGKTAECFDISPGVDGQRDRAVDKHEDDGQANQARRVPAERILQRDRSGRENGNVTVNDAADRAQKIARWVIAQMYVIPPVRA